MANGRYHYTECGLDDVYLVGGFEFVDAPSGRQVVISDLDGLHAAIGRHLVNSKKGLSKKEIRFLRHEMSMSQSTLARLLAVSEQAVRRWEAGKSTIPGPAEALLRLLYRESTDHGDRGPGPKSIRAALKDIADLEDEFGKMTFRDSGAGWQRAA